ncbi:polyamine transporter [Diplodia corticola]|uniref:Polyamine transporter n=1 Tax=Diplodia corticola TaxID=236234 RepID=A0A1J9QM28_9PEZI|nr:polyamine transporter [Diplodia corticola]OJD29520.1 polyamine transporter [Diplodia corticola]
MENQGQDADRFDPADLEKELEPTRTSKLNDSDSPSGGIRATPSDDRILLSEEQALNRARELPNSTDPIYLTYSIDDKENPRNWPKWKRWYITCFVSMLNVFTCLCAGGYSSGQEQLIAEFDVSAEVGTVGLSMYILGFAVGPLMLAPLSEYFGRNPVYVWSWLLLVIFQIPLALAPNIGTVIVCRLLQGFFGSAPLTNTGGTVSDLWARNDCGSAMAIYGLSSTFGPPLALVISGYIAQNMGWRWLFWVYMAIFGGYWLLLVLTVPETRHSIILDKKAKRLRKRLRAEGLTAAADNLLDANADEKKGLHTLFAITLTRPFRFLFTEPITIFAALYNGWIYGIVYLLNEAIPLVFGTGHAFTTGQWGCSFAGLAIGSLLAASLHLPLQERHYLRRVAASGTGAGCPEARMHLARFGTFLLPASLFWFAWTSFPTVHWLAPVAASALFGAGIYVIILAILNYVVDSYQTYSASALAGVILVRNLVGAGFPLFGRQMYERLGWEWASSLLAFLSVPLCAIPFVFFYWGEAIRLRSPWAREHFAQDEDKPH